MLAVGIPVYKAKDTLPDLLNSLVAQTRKNFFTVLSIDADGEDYSEIIEEYRKRGLHISVINAKENGGPGMARQRVIDATAMCDYLVFCDADDILYPNALETLYVEAKKNNADIVSANFAQESKHNPSYIVRAKESPVTWFHGKIYRRQYLIDNDIKLLPKFRLNEDSYFNLVAINCTDKKFSVDETVYLWRDNKNSLTRSISAKEFFLRGHANYIESQIDAVKKILEVKNKISLLTLAATLINIYEQMMLEIHYKAIDTSYIDSLKEFKNIEFIQDTLNNVDFWIFTMQKLKPGAILDGNIFVFYKQRYIDWINEYIRGDSNISIQTEIKEELL